MIGSLLTRGLVMVLGYAYPAYECYKSVELNKPDINQLRFWCQYWVLVAGLTIFERIGDTFIGWVPMYGEAKLAFFIYLWYPKTKGTTYVYGSFFRPYIEKHETEIDRNLLELKTRAGDLAFIYWQKTASYAQTRVFDILQFVAAQSTPKRSAQQEAKVRKPSTPSAHGADVTTQPQDEQPFSPASSSSSSEQEEDAADVAESSGEPKAAPAPVVLKEQKTTLSQALVTSSSSIEQVMQIDSVNDTTPTIQETAVTEEALRLTRTKYRKTRAATSNR
ncbi:putative HVA22-like protein g isoform X2 [Salvia miltiorrhiza]|uniref:putative HVA22-like protein g isoform X2 n=1 Tax=Salvia miltiorrhiza TaxID=226208 RepID=UPI0025AC3DC3|nr:putative HVA22-like protein g isoform X2 [Salvia miltiorrhiza]XP_057766084.1 putative HVA22-like protein g isoform X2 [Salvia miltiorrhiza]